jgi:hypothetical protein
MLGLRPDRPLKIDRVIGWLNSELLGVFDPTATFAVRCGNRFDASFGPTKGLI